MSTAHAGRAPRSAAERRIEYATDADTGMSRDWPAVNATLAVALATLALAAEQRTANLIALGLYTRAEAISENYGDES